MFKKLADVSEDNDTQGSPVIIAPHIPENLNGRIGIHITGVRDLDVNRPLRQWRAQQRDAGR